MTQPSQHSAIRAELLVCHFHFTSLYWFLLYKQIRLLTDTLLIFHLKMIFFVFIGGWGDYPKLKFRWIESPVPPPLPPPMNVIAATKCLHFEAQKALYYIMRSMVLSWWQLIFISILIIFKYFDLHESAFMKCFLLYYAIWFRAREDNITRWRASFSEYFPKDFQGIASDLKEILPSASVVWLFLNKYFNESWATLYRPELL